MKKMAKVLIIIMIASFFFAACAPQTVIETVEVEKEVITTVEVEKEVVITVEVEKIVEVMVTEEAEPMGDPGEVVILGFGGTTQASQDTAFFTPFEIETGTKVIQDVDPSIDRLKAMVDSGSVSADIAQGDMVSYLLGVEAGLWEPIDYSYFSEEDLAAIPEDQMKEYGFGNIFYSQIIGIDKRAYPEDGPFPQNYVDFWDVEKFPGMRALPSCTNPWEALPEAAILSTGAAPEDVYPIDIDLALEQIKKIAPNTIFWDSPAVPAQLLTDQQVVMAQAPNGRIKVLISAGVPLEIVWDQARIQSDFWFVLKDSPNKENAMKFLAFAARPEQQAIMAKLTAYPPINPLMYDYIDEATAKLLPNYPDNMALSYPAGHEWWAEYGNEWAERCTEALLE